MRDFFRTPNIGSGLFHDAKRNRTENFKRCTVELERQEGENALSDEQGNLLSDSRLKYGMGGLKSLSTFVQHLVQDGFLTSPHEWFC